MTAPKLLASLVCCFTLASSPSAWATDGQQPDAARDAARVMFARGIALVDAGQFEEAALAFERAYALRPDDSVLYNAAQAHATARHFSKALGLFRRYLAAARSELPPNRVDDLESEIKQLLQKCAQLSVTLEPKEAELRIDGNRVSSALASSLELDPGEHTLTAVLAGFSPAETSLQLAEGEHRVVPLHLSPIPQQSPTPLPIKTVASPNQLHPRPTPIAPSAGHSRARRQWSFVSAGAGILAAGATVGIVIDNNHRHTDWQDEQEALDRIWAATPASTPGPLDRQRNNDARADRIQTLDQVATGLAVGSAALFGVAALLFFSDDDAAPATSHAFAVGPGRVGWSVTW